MNQFEHLVAATFTPMHDDGRVNLSVIPAYAEHLLAMGVTGIFVCGTTGESSSLSVEERKEVAAEWVRVAQGRLRVIIHVGANALPDCIALSEHAAAIGADAVSTTPPSYFKPATNDALVDWCRQIAAAAGKLPFYFYHIPSLTGVTLPMLDLLRESRENIPTLAGIKYTHGNLMEFQRCLAFDPDRFEVYFGFDEMLLPALAVGTKGAVGSTYNYAGPLYQRMIDAFHQGDLATARAWSKRTIEMIAVLLEFGGLPAGKAILNMQGIDTGPVRSPLVSLSPQRTVALHARLMEAGFDAQAIAREARALQLTEKAR
ncbi:MAG: dihydrodipicolinate synthase family protein [Phycisphaeraceae bacterium]